MRHTHAKITQRARAMEQAITRWMLRAARLEARRATEHLAGRVRKDVKDEELRRELEETMHRFGVAQMRGAFRSKEVAIQVFDAWRAGAERRAAHVSEETKRLVRESVQRILVEASEQDPRPSAGELARRIRTQFHGAPDGRVYAFSPERASLIARTELAQAENLGIYESYREAGVQEIEWLSFTDGRSGERHHERMNGKRVRVGEMFVTPLGHSMRFPGDPDAPIIETANCRCTHRAVTD